MTGGYVQFVKVSGQIRIHLSSGGSIALGISDQLPVDLLAISDQEFDLLSDVMGLVIDYVKQHRRKNWSE